MKIKEIVLKEVKSIEYYTHLWRAYLFYYSYHLFYHFYKDNTGGSKIKLSDIKSQISGVMYIIVNYPEDIEYRLKLDAFADAVEVFLSDKRVATIFNNSSFDQNKYFKKVALEVTEDNEIVD